jgi:hypothetical protein
MKTPYIRSIHALAKERSNAGKVNEISENEQGKITLSDVIEYVPDENY